MFTFNNNKNHLLTLLTVWLAAGLIIASLLAIALSALAAPAAAVGLGPQPAHAATTETFTFTGNQQTFTVPTGVTSVTIEAYGAQGGAGGFDGQAGGAGANGGYVTAAIAAVMPGETLYVYVGGQGGVGGGNGGVGGTAGFNGGAVGGSPGPGGGGGGGSGGASDVRQGGAALADRVVVGGGGAGGGGASPGGVGGVGGAGGATTGAAGVAGVGGAPGNGGGGGTPAAGGAGGTGGIGSDGAAGALGNGGAGGGGAGDEAGGGGGGGGYYGGGGGEQSGIGSSGGGGGGGSSYTDPAATGVTHTQGSRTGDGLVRITYTLAPEIDVQGNGQSIPNGSITPSTADDTDFGSVSVGGAPITHTFTISNSGNADLNLTGMPAVTLTTGAHFNVAAQPASPVISNTTTTFDVTFDPAAAGSFTDTVTIANDDADENPFTFVIAGTGTVAPTFAKSFVPDTIAEGGVSTLTFTIDNTASAQAAIALDFTDNLPAGVVVATPANAATTCGAR